MRDYKEINAHMSKIKKYSAPVQINTTITFSMSEFLNRVKADTGMSRTRLIEISMYMLADSMGYEIDDKVALNIDLQQRIYDGDAPAL